MTWRYVAPIEPRYERLEVLGRAGVNKQGKVLYECRCNCGSPPFRTLGESLRSRRTQSCGCLRNERVRAAAQKRKAERGAGV